MIFSKEFVDLVIIHLGGFVIDASLGFLLFFDVTRPIGFLMGGAFHGLNAMTFNIG